MFKTTFERVALPRPARVMALVPLWGGRMIGWTAASDLLLLDAGGTRWRPIPFEGHIGGVIEIGLDRLLVVGHAAMQAWVLDLKSGHQAPCPADAAQRGFRLVRLDERFVLLAGGTIEDRAVTRCALFDIETERWSTPGDLVRGFSLVDDDPVVTAARIAAGRAVFVGERHAELFDLRAQRWSRAGRVTDGRAALFGAGRLLTYAGELFDPARRRWSVVEGGYRAGGPMVRRPDGWIVAFSRDGLECVDPATGAWHPVEGPADWADIGHLEGACAAVDGAVHLSLEAQAEHTFRWTGERPVEAAPTTPIDALLASVEGLAAPAAIARRIHDALATVTAPKPRAARVAAILEAAGHPVRAHTLWRTIKDWPRILPAPAGEPPAQDEPATLRFVVGDATRPRGEGPRIIAHICNDRGGWGRGFVVALSRRSPRPEADYRAWYRDRATNDFALGACRVVDVDADIAVANMVAQHGYRRQNGRPPIRYEALDAALGQLGDVAAARGASVHMPRIGCGLAGGTWPEVEALVRARLVERGVAVTVYDLPS